MPTVTTALAVRDDQDHWDDKQLAVLYQMGISEQVSKPELAAFLHECQRRRLDPFTRQIYLIGRWDKRAGREVYRPQTSIDGFRVIARRAADAAGIDYSYEDTTWFDGKGGKHEVWLSDTPPAAAKVVVVRNGCRYDGVARYGAYVQTSRDGKPSGQWQSMADVMTAKCGEALALRKAFPEDLGGLYTEDELGQAQDIPPAPAPPAGTVSRPAGEPALPAEREADPDAQAFADEAHEARTRGQLEDIATRARETRKQSAVIADPATGVAGGLGKYIAHRRRQLEDADKALTTLTEAADAAGIPPADVDDHVRRVTGVSLEEATAAQLRETTQVILAGAPS